MAKDEIRKKLEEFRRALEKKGIRVSKMILYGSYARGKNREFSDIDVAIVSPDFGKDRFEEGVVLFKIAAKIDPRLEPVPISEQAFENDTWVPLIYEIRKKGIEVKGLLRK